MFRNADSECGKGVELCNTAQPCVSVRLHASLSVSPPARLSIILNRSTVCEHSDEDGWRDTDDAGKKTL